MDEEKAVIQVDFEVDFKDIESSLKELQDKLSNIKFSPNMDSAIFTDIKKFLTQFNNVKSTMSSAETGTDYFKKLDESVNSLHERLIRTRQAYGVFLREYNEANNLPNPWAEREKTFKQSEEALKAINEENEKNKKLAYEDLRYYEAISKFKANLNNEEQQGEELKQQNLTKDIALQQELNSVEQQNTGKVEQLQNENNLIEKKITTEKQGVEDITQERKKSENKLNTQGLLNIRKKRSLAISAIKEFYNNVKKYTSMWMGLLDSALSKVGAGFKSLLGSIFNRTDKQASSLLSNLKGLLGIAGGIGIYKLGTEAIEVSNDFKTLGDTGAVVARKMSNAFYDAAGDTYNSLVKVSNGTKTVTTTLQKFINTWTGQVSLLKAQLTAIGVNLGNLLIKIFYPLLVVLNKILAVVNLLVNKLASLFGFNTKSLSDILGTVGGEGVKNKGLDEYSKSADKASKATKKLSKETKKASDNLQSYDKLNNNTSKDLDDLTDALDDIADIGVDPEGLIDTDALFNNLLDDLSLVPDWLKKWIDELIALIKAGDWEKVGSHIGDLVNKGLKALDDFLDSPDLLAKIHKFNNNLLDFINGFIKTVDWDMFGRDVAKGLNTITYAIDDLYTQAVEKGTLKNIGDALYDSIMGFAKNVKAEQAGRAAVSLIRSVIDVIYQALSNISDEDMDLLAQKLYDFVKGAFTRLVGKLEGEDKTGAEKIGESIAKIINIGLTFIGKLINQDTAEKAADAIITILNSAINGLDKARLKTALSGLLNFIGTMLTKLATEIDTDDFVDKVTGAINNSIKDGSLQNMVKGLTLFVNKFFDTLIDIVKGTDKNGLFKAVKDGFIEGGGLSLLLKWLEFVVAPSLVLAVVHGVAKAGEWALMGSIFRNGLGGTFSIIAGSITKIFGSALVKGAFKAAGAVGGLTIAFDAMFDTYNNGINGMNASLSIIGGAVAGFSMFGPGGAVVGAVAAGLVELNALWQQYPQIFENVGQKIGEFVGSIIVDLYEFNNKILVNIENAKNSISNKVTEIINNIQQKFNNMINKAVHWGEDFMRGIANGIGNGIKWVTDKVSNIVSDIKNTFTNGFQIASPSKVMESLAIYIPEGVAKGIDDGLSAIDDATSDMIDSIKFTDFYTTAYNETDIFVDDVTNRLKDIETPILDPLKYQSNIINNPASTARTIAQGYADISTQKTDGVLAGIYNRIIGAGQQAGRNVTIDVYLDKNNKLGQYVIDTVRGQVVMTGGI